MITPRKILIVRTDRIGDVVLTLPAASLVKKKYPEVKIVFMVREYTSSLVRDHKHIDEIIIYDEEKNFFSQLKEIKKTGFDSALLVHPQLRLALLLYLAGIKNRIGTGFRWYSFLFNKKLYEHRKYGTKHELLHNLDLLKFFGIKADADEANAEFNIPVSGDSSKKIREVFKKYKVDKTKPVVIIHPGSGGSAIDFPAGGFKKLILLLSELDVELILTGSEMEVELCREISSAKTKNFAGKFNLEELTALINEADIFISNSTGPLHIAAALGKFVVGFYPDFPSVSPVRWGPFTKRKLIFTPACGHQSGKQCEELNCMRSISVEYVFEKLKNIIYSEFSPEK